MELAYLIDTAKIYKGCEPGISQLKSCESVKDLIGCYYDRIDYCLANNFPDNEFMHRYSDDLRRSGVVIDEANKFKNLDKLVLLGCSDCELTLEKWAVSRAYVKHKSKLKIVAKDYAIIMIDALDNSIVEIEESKNARVIVNLYANSKVLITSGNPRIIHKNRFTYEL